MSTSVSGWSVRGVRAFALAAEKRVVFFSPNCQLLLRNSPLPRSVQVLAVELQVEGGRGSERAGGRAGARDQHEISTQRENLWRRSASDLLTEVYGISDMLKTTFGRNKSQRFHQACHFNEGDV